MTPIEALQEIIKQNGHCEGVPCGNCPLSGGMGFVGCRRALYQYHHNKYDGPTPEVCAYMAQQMLTQIAEDELLGLHSDKN